MNEVDEEDCCDDLRAEDFADQYMMADTWVARQGRLAGWLQAQGRLDDAGQVTGAVTDFLHSSWNGACRTGLGDTFRYARAIKEQEVRRRASEETN